MKPAEDAAQAQSLPLIIGHRGAAAVAPENTILSFKRAMTDGADGIEFDVRLARDTVPVVIHDAQLRRTGLRSGAVASLSSTQLSEVGVGRWFNLRFPSLARPEYEKATIPTLAEVFELFHETEGTLYVEMKCLKSESSAVAREVARLILDYEFQGRAIVESFTLEAIAEIKRIAPGIRTAALFEPKLVPPPTMRSIFARTALCRADELALHHLLATRRLIEQATERGLQTVVWTVDNPSWLERARRFGVRAVITNNPALMRDKR